MYASLGMIRGRPPRLPRSAPSRYGNPQTSQAADVAEADHGEEDGSDMDEEGDEEDDNEEQESEQEEESEEEEEDEDEADADGPILTRTLTRTPTRSPDPNPNPNPNQRSQTRRKTRARPTLMILSKAGSIRMLMRSREESWSFVHRTPRKPMEQMTTALGPRRSGLPTAVLSQARRSTGL